MSPIAAYVYPGWHPIPERDAAFHPGFTEWELVLGCRPRFDGHVQPRVPLLGPYDDRDPVEVGRRVRLAREHGVDAFVWGFFWCRGKRVFEDALDRGFLGSAEGRDAPFAVMWANRMPRRVLPVRHADVVVIDPARRVTSDADDFVALVAHLAERYFVRPNYLRVGGRPYFSIFDTSFLLREMGLDAAAGAIRAARAWLAAHGHADLHLGAVEPGRDVIGRLRDVGFDSVTHYVHLPEWKGPPLQDYETLAVRRASEWAGFGVAAGLPYHPSVSPGWDATPRAADFETDGSPRTSALRARAASADDFPWPRRYPWAPVVVGERPDLFRAALERARRFSAANGAADGPVFVASLNEWSEGHYLEPDVRWGTAWLEAVGASRG